MEDNNGQNSKESNEDNVFNSVYFLRNNDASIHLLSTLYSGITQDCSRRTSCGRSSFPQRTSIIVVSARISRDIDSNDNGYLVTIRGSWIFNQEHSW